MYRKIVAKKTERNEFNKSFVASNNHANSDKQGISIHLNRPRYLLCTISTFLSFNFMHFYLLCLLVFRLEFGFDVDHHIQIVSRLLSMVRSPF